MEFDHVLGEHHDLVRVLRWLLASCVRASNALDEKVRFVSVLDVFDIIDRVIQFGNQRRSRQSVVQSSCRGIYAWSYVAGEGFLGLSHLHRLALDLVVDIVLDLLPELIGSLRSSGGEVVAAHDRSENLVLLVVLGLGLAVTLDYPDYLLLGAFSHVGRSKSFVGGQRRHFDLVAVVGINP